MVVGYPVRQHGNRDPSRWDSIIDHTRQATQKGTEANRADWQGIAAILRDLELVSVVQS